MEFNQIKPKSLIYNNYWFSWIFVGLGLLFLLLGILISQLVKVTPETLNLNVNGVTQVATEKDVTQFRLFFLLIFGGIGLLNALIGSVILIVQLSRKRQAQKIKQEGIKISAEVLELTSSAVRVNHRSLKRLLCSYTTSNGRHYLFKSPLLRIDPTPFLKNGKVLVYYDRQNPTNYFVDIDGSVNPVYEL